jgi:peptidyl-prolyl isomerase D
VSIDGEAAGQLVFELWQQDLPRTVENFRCLCTGEKGEGKQGKPLHYAGTKVHRIIDGFMVQASDIVHGDGSGGESIYGDVFDNEAFTHKHDRPYLLSMANAGPNTGNSQFFVTAMATPHLDGLNVVFGELVEGFDLLARLQKLPVDEEDTPHAEVLISSCGALQQ